MKKIILSTFVALVLLENPSTSNSAITEIEPSSKTCEKLDGATEKFLSDVSRKLQIPRGALKVEGATYGLAKFSGLMGCLVYISTPSGPFLCRASTVLSDNGGKTTYAQGHIMPDAKGDCTKS